jgi:ankyrin repeat protein
MELFMAKKIVWQFCGIVLLFGLSNTLLWADGNIINQTDLYTAIDNCNRTKHSRKYGYATDEQLDSNIKIVKQLLEAGADPNMRIPDHTAYIDGYGASLWFMDGEITLLMLSRVARVSEMLIEYGARINDQDNYGRTALMISAFFDNLSDYNDNSIITRMLLRNGANVNIQNNTGQTALHYAIYRANIEAIELFIDNGANVNMGDNKGWSPLVAANIRYYGNSETNDEITQILINAGAVFTDTDRQLINSLKGRHIYWDPELNMNYGDR